MKVDLASKAPPICYHTCSPFHFSFAKLAWGFQVSNSLDHQSQACHSSGLPDVSTSKLHRHFWLLDQLRYRPIQTTIIHHKIGHIEFQNQSIDAKFYKSPNERFSYILYSLVIVLQCCVSAKYVNLIIIKCHLCLFDGLQAWAVCHSKS